jgi:hypothetical protein
MQMDVHTECFIGLVAVFQSGAAFILRVLVLDVSEHTCMGEAVRMVHTAVAN